MKLWGWWRKDDGAAAVAPAPEKKDAAPAKNTKLLEDLPPKFEDDVASAARVRAAARPSVLETIKNIELNDFKNVNKIPCFRQAMLAGVGIGTVTGGVIFLSRRPLIKAANWAMGGFVIGSIITFEQCQFRIRQGKRNMSTARQMYKQQKDHKSPAGEAAAEVPPAAK